jgi:hypothetical protein
VQDRANSGSFAQTARGTAFAKSTAMFKRSQIYIGFALAAIAEILFIVSVR